MFSNIRFSTDNHNDMLKTFHSSNQFKLIKNIKDFKN